LDIPYLVDVKSYAETAEDGLAMIDIPDALVKYIGFLSLLKEDNQKPTGFI
jgi:hypothetical protein